MSITTIMADLSATLREVSQGTMAPHSDLRRRMTAAIVVTLLVDLTGTLLIYALEKGQPNSNIQTIWDAFYFTTSQLTTIGSSFSNPVTMAGQALTLLFDLYAITIVASIAGMFGAFFYHRSVQRHGPPKREEPPQDHPRP